MSKQKIIVVGAGAWGGWSAFMLQRQGYAVTLVDQYGPGNERSGSGGKTRVIRMAYGGDENYTRMTNRSFQLWKEYQQIWNEQLYHETGALWMFGEMSSEYASRSKPLMESLGYPLDELSLKDVQIRYPQINLSGITKTYWEPKCGYLEAARATELVTTKFLELGGNFLNERIIGIRGDDVIEALITDSGDDMRADKYVFACGPWVVNLFPQLKPHIFVSRQEVYYYKSPASHMAPNLPIWLEFQPPNLMHYGIPDHFDAGFKVAYDERDVPLDPDRDSREVTRETFNHISEVVANRFPALRGADLLHHKICVYENSLDGEFIMDSTPGFSNGILLAGSSGHGFKMGPAIGEMTMSFIEEGQDFPAQFGLNRFKDGQSLRSQYEVS